MDSRCNGSQLRFPGLAGRKVVADFDGGHVTSDAGVVLLGTVAQGLALFEQAADCFTDHRDADRIEHSVAELLGQRVLGLTLGYEDLNDHATLSRDPALAVAVGKSRPFGDGRVRRDHAGQAMASPATLNRLENTPAALKTDRPDLKLVHHADRLESLFVDLFLDSVGEAPDQIWLDIDATDVPLHGSQEARSYHGFYDHYCYLPLYIFCGDHLLAAKQRPSNIDGAAGSLDEVDRIVVHIRRRWPEVRVILRADSGFARDYLMTWCENHGVDYVFGLARNPRLEKQTRPLFRALRQQAGQEAPPTKAYREFRYRTKTSWSCWRRVIAKAELLGDKENPRFVVTSLPASRSGDAETVYRTLYCPRGDAENRIKEQIQLFSERASAHALRANQLRLWFSSLAYVLVSELRRRGLVGTDLAKAQPTTIRLRLLKIGAVVRQSVRRIKFSLSGLFPLQKTFRDVLANLYRAYPYLA